MVFEVEKTIIYWLAGAAYDLETGRTLLESKRFPYALFFGHLSLEKVLKALVEKTTQPHAPYTHSLTLLASKTNLEIPESILRSACRIHGISSGIKISGRQEGILREMHGAVCASKI